MTYIVHCPLFLIVAPRASIPWDVWLPYITGSIILVVGLRMVLRQTAQRHGADRIGIFAPVFMAVPIAVFGTEHFTATAAVMRLMPPWIPAHKFWVLFVGVALVSAALSIALNKCSALAAALFALMILLFEVLLSIPRVVAAPANRFAWAVAVRDLVFCAGAICLAAVLTEKFRTQDKARVVGVARILIGAAILFFGVEHLLHPEFAPGVPLVRLTPTWIPAHLLWCYLTGAVFIVAGFCLVINQKSRSVASWLGLVIFLLALLIYVPIVIAAPSDIASGLNYLVDTLFLSGSVLAFAESQRGKVAFDG